MIWLDAQLSPHLAPWIKANFAMNCKHVRELDLREADDLDIFFAAKTADVIILTKDADFLELLLRHKAPPKILWLTCGNTSTKRVGMLLRNQLQIALDLLKSGEDLVEITD